MRHGQSRFFYELDAINLMRTLRQSRLLTKNTLTKEQSILMEFQRENVIDSNSSSMDFSDNENNLRDLNNKGRLASQVRLMKLLRILK